MASMGRGERAWNAMTRLRRVLLTIVGVQLALAITMTLVDSYRRRGKKPKPFPTVQPQTVAVGDGTLTAYTYGEDLYAAMLEAIDNATNHILFETYIWKADEVGEAFKEALIRAADRGVAVYCIYDVFANLVVDPRFKRFPDHVTVLRYPVYNAGLKFWELRRYGRDHRKILVVDGNVGFVGGYNIGAAYATEWRDTHVRITGDGAWELERAFADMWNAARRQFLRGRPKPLTLKTQTHWEPRVRFLRNSPRQWSFPIRSMYLEAFDRASRNIWLTTAYFLPDQDFVDSLLAAAQRGVDVRILLPLKSNHVVADWISRGYFSQLLGAGVRILRYRDAMIHAKTATIDGNWSTVGTANIDRLSLAGNYEINMEVIDADVARVAEEIFEVDQSHSLELTSHEWEARDLHRKFTEAFLAPLRPLL